MIERAPANVAQTSSPAFEAGSRIVARRTVYDGWYRLEVLGVEIPGGVQVERHLIDNGSAVGVLPYDAERRTALLVTQPRAPVLDAGEPPLFEVIAGGLDGAAPHERIVEEAMEEGGLRLGALEPVCNMWSLPPVSTERVMLYLSQYSASDRVAAGGGAEGEHEAITVHEIALEQLAGMVRAGTLTDGKTLICAQALMLRRPELFA